jgi:hypothetical protein
MCARFDINPGVLLGEIVPAVVDDEAVNDHIGRLNADDIALIVTAEGGAVDALQPQRFIDDHMVDISAALDLHRIARHRRLHGGLDRFARVDCPFRCQDIIKN